MSKIKKWLTGIVSCFVLGPLLAMLGLMLLIAAPVMVIAALIGGGGSANVQVGDVNIAQLATLPASNAVYQVYPANAPITHFNSSDQYSVPIPPEATLEADLAIDTPYQLPLIAKCYATWANPTEYGGQPCGFSGYPGQCTFWALLNWDNPDMKVLNGNADQYYDNAIGLGLAVSQTPEVGSMVVWDGGGQYGSNGHVAMVVALDPSNNAFVISEMNYDYTPWMIDYRIVSMTAGGPGHGNLEGFVLPSGSSST